MIFKIFLILGAFRLYDLDNDGFITREEMLSIVRSIYKMVGSKVKLPDNENTPEKRVDQIFRMMDKVNFGLFFILQVFQPSNIWVEGVQGSICIEQTKTGGEGKARLMDSSLITWTFQVQLLEMLNDWQKEPSAIGQRLRQFFQTNT